MYGKSCASPAIRQGTHASSGLRSTFVWNDFLQSAGQSGSSGASWALLTPVQPSPHLPLPPQELHPSLG